MSRRCPNNTTTTTGRSDGPRCGKERGHIDSCRPGAWIQLGEAVA